MNEILKIIGSVASILGVPLAVYLYLKSQVEKYASVRREIVKRLSHQIGEGRTVGLFELNAVIDSLVRENRLRRGSITGNSVIEDLIAETVSSPLLESSRKEQLIAELSKVHSIGKVFKTIESDNETFEKFLAYLQVEVGSTDEAEDMREKIVSVNEKSPETFKTPELFAVIFAAIGTIGVIAEFSGITGRFYILPKILDSNIIANLSLGIAASGVAVIVAAAVITKYTSKNNA